MQPPEITRQCFTWQWSLLSDLENEMFTSPFEQLLGCVRRSQEIKTELPEQHSLWFKADVFVTKGAVTLISASNM